MKRILAAWLCVYLIACSPVSTAPAASNGLDSDAEMESAFQQARDSLDIFIEKIGTPHPDRTYAAIKVRFFPPGDLSQDIWVDEVTYEEGVFRGSMGDDIPTLRLQAGEEITVQEADIMDWMIVEDGKLIGGYTIRLAYDRMTPAEKERFLESIDYSIED
ncbi:MAG TPA: DUF2314 domain-containing protein [Anaerolineales bacterium]|nr:DUF2314 domain-containing protein [Anaerolineales bacterium]